MTFDPTPLRPVGRRAARLAEQRRRRKRNQRLVVAVAAMAVVALVAGLVLTRGGDDNKDAANPRSQRTILMQVRGTTGAIASALLAHDSKASEGSAVLVPPQVIATIPGLGAQPFGRALVTSSPEGSAAALADLMGVTIDGTWVLDGRSFSRLIEQEGGIEVTVDVPVMAGRGVVLSAGAQRIDGTRALAYATYLARGEVEQARLARLQRVLDGIISSLPGSPRTLLTSLGAGSRSSLSVDKLAAVLSGMKADDGKDQLQYRSLPVIKVDTGAADTRFRVDAVGTRQLVDELLAGSIPPGARATGNRVLVLNGVGTPGLGEKVRAKLVPAGFVFVGSRNANSFGYTKTQVLVRDATPAGSALGARVARALGVPVSSVRASTQIGTIADVIVIVGRDFRAK
jgi:anionic cell wall polymer biosynthesis LytR-Cps2A-Psr (LCP) family protein